MLVIYQVLRQNLRFYNHPLMDSLDYIIRQNIKEKEIEKNPMLFLMNLL